MPNVNLTTIEPMIALHHQFPDCTSVAMGLHPTEIRENWQDDLCEVEKHLNAHEYVAIGEVGIDLYWDTTYRRQQIEAFDTQLDWAFSRSLPVIIHCRNGLSDILDLFESRKGRLPRCVFHSFGGTAEDVAAIRDYGDHYFGINGIVTFKNSHLRDVLPVIGINRILLETDSPYLAPVPHRGHRNESAFLIHTANCVALSMNIPLDSVSAYTSANAIDFFYLNF